MSAPPEPARGIAGGLAGRRVLVGESRELDLFAGILERAGASVLRCPLVAIHDVVDPAPIEAWLRRLIAGADDLVLYTGEGLRRLLGVAERASLLSEMREALERVRRIVRGPKPTRVLRSLALAPDLVAPAATTAGLLDLLAPLDLAGRRMAVQLYPEQPSDFVSFLVGKGAVVDAVVPYRYADDVEDRRVLHAIQAMAAGEVDLVAFTASPQVRRLAAVARAHDAEADLARGMARTAVAAIGPVTAEALAEAGWRTVVAPAESFHLKPLVAAMARLPAARGEEAMPSDPAADLMLR